MRRSPETAGEKSSRSNSATVTASVCVACRCVVVGDCGDPESQAEVVSMPSRRRVRLRHQQHADRHHVVVQLHHLLLPAPALSRHPSRPGHVLLRPADPPRRFFPPPPVGGGRVSHGPGGPGRFRRQERQVNAAVSI